MNADILKRMMRAIANGSRGEHENGCRLAGVLVRKRRRSGTPSFRIVHVRRGRLGKLDSLVAASRNTNRRNDLLTDQRLIRLAGLGPGFYVLRPDRQRVLAEYLAWCINQRPAQAFLARHSRGTLVKLLPKGVFEELEVPVPPLEKQRLIVDIEHLRAREEFLFKRLADSRARLVQHLSLVAVKDEFVENCRTQEG
jgi:hypothetical protein